MRWSKADLQAADRCSTVARFACAAATIDSRDVWGSELVVLHGGVGTAAAGDGDHHAAMGDVVALQAESGTWFAPEVSPDAASPVAGTIGGSPGPRAFHCAAAVDRSMYIFGGDVLAGEGDRRRRVFFNDLWVLDTDMWRWRLEHPGGDSPDVPPCRDMTAIARLDGWLIMFGGRGEGGRLLSDLWAYDLARRSWRPLRPAAGPSPGPRKMHTLVTVKDRLMLFGGERDGGLLDELWTLKAVPAEAPPQQQQHESPQPSAGAAPHVSPASLRWVWTPIKQRPSPAGRFGHSMALAGGALLVFGGCLDVSGFFSVGRSYSHCNELWALHLSEPFGWVKLQEAPALDDGSDAPPPERMCHTMVPLSGCRLLVTGGRRKDAICDDSWWLDASGPLSLAALQQLAAQQQQQLQQPLSAGAASQPVAIPAASTTAAAVTAHQASPSNSSSSFIQSLITPLAFTTRRAAEAVPTAATGKVAQAPEQLAQTMLPPGVPPPPPPGTTDLSSGSVTAGGHSPTKLPSVLQQPQPPTAAADAPFVSSTVLGTSLTSLLATATVTGSLVNLSTAALDRLSTTVTSTVSSLLTRADDAGRQLGKLAVPLPASTVFGAATAGARALQPAVAQPEAAGQFPTGGASQTMAAVQPLDSTQAAAAAAMQSLRSRVGLPPVPTAQPAAGDTEARTLAALAQLGQALKAQQAAASAAEEAADGSADVFAALSAADAAIPASSAPLQTQFSHPQVQQQQQKQQQHVAAARAHFVDVSAADQVLLGQLPVLLADYKLLVAQCTEARLAEWCRQRSGAAPSTRPPSAEDLASLLPSLSVPPEPAAASGGARSGAETTAAAAALHGRLLCLPDAGALDLKDVPFLLASYRQLLTTTSSTIQPPSR